MHGVAPRTSLHAAVRAEPLPLVTRAQFSMPSRFLPLFIVVLVAGCSALERMHDCDSVVDVVNAGLEDVRFDAPDAGSDDAYEHIATAYDDVSKRIEALEIGDTALAKAVGTYREIVERAARNSRAYARELNPGQTSRDRRAAERRLEKIRAQARSDLGREASAVRKINALCRPH
jgi:hypothetical protein